MGGYGCGFDNRVRWWEITFPLREREREREMAHVFLQLLRFGMVGLEARQGRMHAALAVFSVIVSFSHQLSAWLSGIRPGREVCVNIDVDVFPEYE